MSAEQQIASTSTTAEQSPAQISENPISHVNPLPTPLDLPPSAASIPQSPAPDPPTPGPHSMPYHVRPSESSLGPVIGTTKFAYDGEFLDDYVIEVLKLWKGKREPVGVDIEDSGRCK